MPPLKHSESKATKVPKFVHFDICGPIETKSLSGATYSITFIDDYSIKVFVYFLHQNSEALENSESKDQVEKQFEYNFLTDNGFGVYQ